MTSIDDRISRLITLDERLLDAAELAVEEAIKMLADPRTPAPARATVISTVFRANGVLDVRRDGGGTKEPHEMSADELHQQISRLRREAADRAVLVIEAKPALASVGEDGVFE